jgi:hypothetical protein
MPQIGDIVLAAVKFPRFGITVEPTHPSWRQTRLKASSVVRTDKLCTLNTRVIAGRLGVLPSDLLNAIRGRLKTLFAI